MERELPCLSSETTPTVGENKPYNLIKISVSRWADKSVRMTVQPYFVGPSDSSSFKIRLTEIFSGKSVKLGDVKRLTPKAMKDLTWPVEHAINNRSGQLWVAIQEVADKNGLEIL